MAIHEFDATAAAPLANRSSNSRRPSLLKRLSLKRNNNNGGASATENVTPTAQAPPPPETVKPKKSQMSSSFRLLRRRKKLEQLQLQQQKTATSDDDTDTMNVLTFLEMDCPDDVLPKVLAFCGPQKWTNLNRTNRFWNALLREESTWKVLCEELYKVSM